MQAINDAVDEVLVYFPSITVKSAGAALPSLASSATLMSQAGQYVQDLPLLHNTFGPTPDSASLNAHTILLAPSRESLLNLQVKWIGA
jgi:hypothetical protein